MKVDMSLNKIKKPKLQDRNLTIKSFCVLSRILGWVGSYLSIKIQSAYFITPVAWARFHLNIPQSGLKTFSGACNKRGKEETDHFSERRNRRRQDISVFLT